MAAKARAKAAKGTSAARPGRFPLSSEDCELLVALEATGSTDGVAKVLAKHASVVSRQLADLAERSPVLEKPGGRWRLTGTGLRIARWAREQSREQESILFAPAHVTIATTRELGARVLAPALDDLHARLSVSRIDLVLVEAGVEGEVLAGRVDAGITCGRPADPAVGFKNVIDEAYVLVVPAAWPKRTVAATLEEPHVQYSRGTAPKLLGLEHELTRVVGVFNDIAAVREACVAGAGWGVLPRYAVAREIATGQLRVVEGAKIPPDRFAVFWLRSRAASLPWLSALGTWAASLDL